MASPFDLSSSEPSAGSSPRLFALPLNGPPIHHKALAHHSKHRHSHGHSQGQSHSHGHSHHHGHGHGHATHGHVVGSLSGAGPVANISNASASNSASHISSVTQHIRSLQSPFPPSSTGSSSASGTSSSTPGPILNVGSDAAAGSALNAPPRDAAASDTAEFPNPSTLTLVANMSTDVPKTLSSDPQSLHPATNSNSGLSSLLHSPLHQPQPPLHLTQPLGTFPKQRLSSINSITSNHSVSGALNHLITTNIPSSHSHQPRSMSIISLNSPRESLISADDLKNLPGTRNNSYNSLVSLLDSTLRKQKHLSTHIASSSSNHNTSNINSSKRGDTASVSDDEDALRLNYNMLMSSLKPPMGHGKLQLPASMVFTEFKRLSSGSNSINTPSNLNTVGANYASPNSSHLKMHDLTPSPLSLAENPFNDYNFAQAQARHRQFTSLNTHKIDPIQPQQPVSDAESDISLVDHSNIPDGDREITVAPTVSPMNLLPSMSPTTSAVSNVSMASTNLGLSTSSMNVARLRTPSLSGESQKVTNPAKKLKRLRQILPVSKASSKKSSPASASSSQPSTSSQALLLKKKYIFSKDVQFELLQKKTAAVNEMITTKFVRLSSLPQSKARSSTSDTIQKEPTTRSKSFDEKSTGSQWRQQQKLIQQLNRKWNKNDLESSGTTASTSTTDTGHNSRKRSRGEDDDDD